MAVYQSADFPDLTGLVQGVDYDLILYLYGSSSGGNDFNGEDLGLLGMPSNDGTMYLIEVYQIGADTYYSCTSLSNESVILNGEVSIVFPLVVDEGSSFTGERIYYIVNSNGLYDYETDFDLKLFFSGYVYDMDNWDGESQPPLKSMEYASDMFGFFKYMATMEGLVVASSDSSCDSDYIISTILDSVMNTLGSVQGQIGSLEGTVLSESGTIQGAIGSLEGTVQGQSGTIQGAIGTATGTIQGSIGEQTGQILTNISSMLDGVYTSIDGISIEGFDFSQSLNGMFGSIKDGIQVQILGSDGLTFDENVYTVLRSSMIFADDKFYVVAYTLQDNENSSITYNTIDRMRLYVEESEVV